MKEKMIKYANVILTSCLHIKKEQPLLINANIERIDFVRIVANEAYKLGVKDIYFDLVDPVLKHDAMLNLEEKDLKKLSFWNKEKWSEYAKKNAAFLMITSETPGLMKDIDPQKENNLKMYAFKTRKAFNDLRDQSKVAWCIATVPTMSWAKEVFPDAKDPVNKLWNTIFKICGIDNKNPEKDIIKNVNYLTKRCDILNSLNIKKLTYKNKLGTDFTVELPENHLWKSGEENLQNGDRILVNYPTYEVFTCPKRDTASGIVYSSKPLCYQNTIIDDFWIKFDKGKVIDFKAKKGNKILAQMINSCKNSNYLGEIALVPYDSPISKSNIIFYETLFDENASCHLALGSSFPECIVNGSNMSKDELTKIGLNTCDNHVDFMIGTKDLNIIGETVDGKKVEIFKDGNFTKKFM
ncbi:MAG: aminopeptidase [Bacilli bacterium]